MQKEGITKSEARRNVETFLHRVRSAEATKDTTAWKKPVKRFYKVVDGHKILRERMVQEENAIINQKLSRIMHEDRRKLTKEYAPGLRVGNVSGGGCIDCYRTENPLALAYEKLHNRKLEREKKAKVIARHNADLKRNIDRLRSPYSAEECQKFYTNNRYRARFFLQRNEDPNTTKHLGLDPRERQRAKEQKRQLEAMENELNRSPREVDPLADPLRRTNEIISHTFAQLNLSDVKQTKTFGDHEFIPAGNRVGGVWRKMKQRPASAGVHGRIDRDKSPAYQFGLNIERLVETNSFQPPVAKKATRDVPLSPDESKPFGGPQQFPAPFAAEVMRRPHSALLTVPRKVGGKYPAHLPRVVVEDPVIVDTLEIDSSASDFVAGGASTGNVTPRSNELNLLKDMVSTKTKKQVHVSADNEPRHRKMRIMVNDDMCISDVGVIKKLSEFPNFDHITPNSSRDVDISTSTGILVEAGNAEPLFVDMNTLLHLIPTHTSDVNMKILGSELRRLACLHKVNDPPLFEAIADALQPEHEQILGDAVLRVVHIRENKVVLL
jgi:hypothetical protein